MANLASIIAASQAIALHNPYMEFQREVFSMQGGRKSFKPKNQRQKRKLWRQVPQLRNRKY